MIVTMEQAQAMPYRELLGAIADAHDIRETAAQTYHTLVREAQRRHEANPELRAEHEVAVREILNAPKGDPQAARSASAAFA